MIGYNEVTTIKSLVHIKHQQVFESPCYTKHGNSTLGKSEWQNLVSMALPWKQLSVIASRPSETEASLPFSLSHPPPHYMPPTPHK